MEEKANKSCKEDLQEICRLSTGVEPLFCIDFIITETLPHNESFVCNVCFRKRSSGYVKKCQQNI